MKAAFAHRGVDTCIRDRVAAHRRVLPLLAGVLVMLVAPLARGQLILTEFMADNDHVRADEDGDFEDWIEIHNPSPAAVDLAGWSLTDNAGNLVKWMFPATNLQAGAYLVVFASGKDRAIAGQELHTSFKLSADGEYLALVASNGTAIATEFAPEYPTQFSDVAFGFGAELSTAELLSTNAAGRYWVPTHGGLGSTWTETGFNDASWTAAANGVGYDTGAADPAEDSYAASVAASGPALYWRLDETDSSTAANLGSFGAAADGAYQGGATQGVVGPRPPDIDGFEPDNLATEFDGIDGMVTGPIGFLSDRGAFAMAGWIRPNSIPSSSVGLFGQNDAIEFGFQGSQLNVWTDSGGATGLTYPFPPGEWHHALVQGTGEQLEIYLDGTLAASTTVSTSNYGSPADFPFNVGGVVWNFTGGHFDGAIDEVSVWPRALSSQEITNLLEQTAGAGIDYTPHIATDVQADMLGANASVYLRFPFQVTSPADVDHLLLRMKYDDGFVAYLNGEEMASRYAPVSPTWDATATTRHPDPVAVQFETMDGSSVSDFLVPGTNVLAIQGLNIEATNADFLIAAELQGTRYGTLSSQGIYLLTPTPGEPNQAGVDELGPLIQDLAHSPAQPGDDDDLLVTARITPTFSAVAGVTLHYRVMFAGEVAVAMNDAGTGGDVTSGDGTWSARIPAAASSPGQMVRYYVSTLDGGGLSSRWPLFPDPLGSAEYLGTVIAPGYVTSKLPILHLFAPPNVLQPGPNTSQTGADSKSGGRVSAYFDGEFYDNIFMRLRGNSTAGYTKKSHRLEFNREHLFRHAGPGGRIRKTSFTADYPDPTYMRQGLTFWLCGEVGAPGPFYEPYRLQLNGAFYQLANHNDLHREELLERLGYDPDGALYNAAGTIQPGGSSSGGFDKKTRTWEGNADYVEMAEAVSESLPTDQRAINLFDRFDLPEVISYLVVARFVHENDDVWANMSVYHDNDGDDLWRIIPFDMNLSWGAAFVDSDALRGIQVDNDSLKSHPLYGSSQTIWQTGGNWNRIYDAIFQVPQTREMFLRRMRTVLDTWVKSPGASPGQLPIEAKALAWRDLIVEEAAIDRAWWGWPGNGGQCNFDPGIGLTDGVDILLTDFLEKRRQHFYGKHSITNTALPIGISKTDNAGIPLAQPTNAVIAIVGWDYNPVSGNQDEEYICLTNDNPYAVDISGWRLAGGVSHRMQPSTVIPAGGALYLTPKFRAFRDRAVAPHGGMGLFVQGGYNGHLNAWGETLTLIDDTGRLVSSNSFVGTPSSAQQFLRVTEVMYNPSPAPAANPDPQQFEYIELRNISTTDTLDLTGCRFTDGVDFSFTGSAVTSLGPGQRALVVRNATAFNARYGAGAPIAGEFTGALDNQGETLRLDDATGEKILEFTFNNAWYRITDGLGFSLVIVDDLAPWSTWGDKSSWRPSGVLDGSPGASDTAPAIPAILVNEALTHTDPQVDAIELWNPTPGAVDLGGWFLTDDFYTPKKYRIPAGTPLASGAYLPIGESQFNPTPGVPPSFALSSTGDEVYLFSADASSNLTGYVHGFAFGAAANGISFGRYVTSEGKEHFVAQSANTLGGANAGPRVGPIVIAEIMYHPIDVGGADNDLDEFIELRNISGSPALLYDAANPTNHWRLRRAVDYTFPAGISLAAGEGLLVVGFDPADAVQAAAFRTVYDLAPTVPLYGPWQGKLDNSDETVALERPDTPNPDAVPYILVEQVDYEDSAPWPVEADGAGDSLQRNVLSAYGNDPTNWFGSFPTPDAVNLDNERPTVTLTGPAPGSEFLLPTNILITADASDPDGSIARVEFYDGGNLLGEDATFPYSQIWTNPSPGTHQLTARAYDDHQAWQTSQPVSTSVVTLRPSVTLVHPEPGAIFGEQEVVLLQADAVDFDGSVAQVQFLRDGVSLGIVTASPWELPWTATPTGLHSLSAIVEDDSGLSSTSEIVQVSVVATITEFQTLVPAGAIWRYLDNGSNQGTDWYAPVFDDAGWDSGPAQLGYGDGDEATVVESGPSFNHYITTYFRHEFVASDVPPDAALEVQILRDDGAIAYLNGVEIFRQNLPSGAVDYQTPATATVGPNEENLFFPESVDAALLQPGTNLLAVEIHQAGPSNPDISFDARLILSRTIQGPAIVASPTNVTANLGEDATFQVDAVGTEPLSYQWTQDGIAVPGANQATLTLTNIAVADGGSFAVSVTNPAGSAVSAAALLTVLGGDVDGDGLADAWENLYFPGVNILLILPEGDPDGDLATNQDEYEAGSDPTRKDTDGDGLSDGEEIHVLGTDPTLADSDGDGLGDGVEISLYDTDPILADSDGDSLPDGDEVLIHGTNPTLADTDDDTWADDVEISVGTDPSDASSTPQTLAGPGIGVNLHEASGGEQILGPTEQAGFVVQANWNNVAADSPQPLVALDREGNATSLNVRWSLSNTWRDGGAGSTDERLALGYFDDGDTPSLAAGDGGIAGDGIGVSVTINNVPYPRYVAVLYLNSDHGPAGSFGAYSVNDHSQVGGGTPGDIAGRGWVLGENLLMFSGLTNSTCGIRVAARAGDVRGSLAAFQLIETPVRTVVLPPRILGMSIAPGANTTYLEWSSTSGQVYQVQISNGPSGAWGDEPGAPPMPASGGTVSWSGSLSAGGSNAVYRVIIEP